MVMQLEMLNELPSHPFWEFSQQIYASKPVEAACLLLQDKRGMNVNILLFACWLAQTGRGSLQKSDFDKIHPGLSYWHKAITQNLRYLRKCLTQADDAEKLKSLRRDFIEHELLAEQVEQLMLANGVIRAHMVQRAYIQKVNDALASMFAYAKYLNIKLNSEDYQAIKKILMVIFPKVNMQAVQQWRSDMSEQEKNDASNT